jgi:hypothetical protein
MYGKINYNRKECRNMERITVIGVQKTEFKPEDSEKKIKGCTLWVGYPREGKEGREGVKGMVAERIFITEEKLQGLELEPGDFVKLNYNKYGKVASIELDAGAKK